jgi:hypothetical protein
MCELHQSSRIIENRSFVNIKLTTGQRCFMDGAELIAKERRRQVSHEGWDSGHDDEHDEGQLALSAACYAIPPDVRDMSRSGSVSRLWPFEDVYWKPTPKDRIRELVKAGAMIAAEIDRLQRLHDDEESDHIVMRVTARFLMDKDLWMKACELTGTNDWAIRNGQMDEDDEISLTQSQAEKLGLCG